MNTANQTVPGIPPLPPRFLRTEGIVSGVSDFDLIGCTKLFQLYTSNGGVVNFVIPTDCYFLHSYHVRAGARIIVFHRGDVPVPLIYPPRYTAVAVAPPRSHEIVQLARFDRDLTSEDGSLQLTLTPETEIVLTNHQLFGGTLAGRDLLVTYRSATQTVPIRAIASKIVVLCPPTP